MNKNNKHAPANDQSDSDDEQNSKVSSTEKPIQIDSEERKIKSNVPVYKYNEIDFNNVQVSEPKKFGRQKSSFIFYNDPKLNSETRILVQTDKIKLINHPIPRLDPEGTANGFYPDDSKREFIKISLDNEQKSCRKLRKNLEDIDAWANSLRIKKILFGNNYNDYIYQPCIKIPKKDDEKDKKPNAPKFPQCDWVKMNFNIFNTEKEKIIKTVLRKTGVQKPIPVKEIQDIANEITLNTELRLVFQYSKIWIFGTKSAGSNKTLYGVGFKVMTIQYTPGISKRLNIDDIEFRSGDEDSNDSNDSKEKPKSDDKKSKNIEITKKQNKSEDGKEKKSNRQEKKNKSKNNNDSDDDSEPITINKKKKPESKKSNKKNKKDSKKNDSEDISITKKKKEPKNDDDSGEEIRPMKKNRKNK